MQKMLLEDYLHTNYLLLCGLQMSINQKMNKLIQYFVLLMYIFYYLEFSFLYMFETKSINYLRLLLATLVDTTVQQYMLSKNPLRSEH